MLVLLSIGHFHSLKQFYTQKQFLFPALIFFLFILSYRNVEVFNYKDFIQSATLKVPFLLLAFAFAILPAITEKTFNKIYYYFFLLTFLTALATFVYFLIHYKVITASYLSSKVMPTPVNHVRYSLILALSILTGLYLYFKQVYLYFQWERKFLLGATLFLFFFIHLLSVRSGLLALYACLLAGLLYIGIKRRQLKIAWISIFLLLTLPAISYFTVPTFKNKVKNTLEDLKRIGDPESAQDYSLVGRIVSYKVAYTLFEESPWFGTGIANLKSRVFDIYKSQFPEVNGGTGPLLPHNQFIYILAAYGITGLLAFCFLFYFPLFYKQNYRQPLLLGHYMIVSVSFLFEATLETQTGVYFTLVFILLPLFYLKEHKPLHLS